MAIIACPECKKQISDKAPTCVSCGAPINTTGTTTIQKTSKNLKSCWLISIVLFFGGLYLAINATNDTDVAMGFAWTLVGIIMFFITKIRIWWCHK